MKNFKMVRSFFCFFLSFFILFILFLLAIMICINNFVDLDGTIWFWGVVGVSTILSFIVTVLTKVHSKNSIGETKVSFWLHKNYPKIIVGYLMLIFAFVSIKNESIWTTEEVYDILSLQWMIFGLSLTIFLVWNVIIVEFLKRRQPQEQDSDDVFKKSKIVLEKHDFSQEVEATYLTVIILTINLMFLLLSTSLIYIVFKPDSVFVQNLLRCSFFLTTNSIISLFFDILKPLKKEKREMLKNNNVTKSDVNKAYIALLIKSAIEEKKKELNLVDENFTQEEKEKLYSTLLEVLQNRVHNDERLNRKKEPLNGGDNNGKIERI